MNAWSGVAGGMLALVVLASPAAAQAPLRIEVFDRPGELAGVEPLPAVAGAGRCAVLVERTAVERRWQLSLLCHDARRGPSLRLLGEVTSSRAPGLGAGIARGRLPQVLLGLPDGRIVAHTVEVDEGRLGPPILLLDDASIGRARPEDRPDLDRDGTADLLLAVPRGMAAWCHTGERFSPLSQLPLPRRASFASLGPELRVSRSGYLRTDDTASRVRWFRPERRRAGRLSVRRVSFADPEAPSTCEAWIRTVEPLNAGAFRVLDGERGPLLIVLTLPAERVSILGEWSLLLAPLRCDRTGRGVEPLATSGTPIPVWSHAYFGRLRDHDGDGVADLVLHGVSGRLRPRVELLLYDGAALRRGELPRPRGVSFSMKRGDIGPWEIWDVDLDDDGRVDLLFTPRQGVLAWIRGAEGRGRAFPLASRPAAEVPFPERLSGARSLRPLRLEGGPDLALIPAVGTTGSGPHHVLGVVYRAPSPPL